tara:strand:+ start:1147 stop:1920 length:774 start_codon:yes stop_codon:yes gene_type:complete
LIVLLFFRFFIFLLLIVILLPFQLIIVFFKKEYSYIIPYFFHKINCRVFGIEIKTSGNISKKIPTLLVSNHASYLDILILGSLFKTSFLSKKEVGQWPLIGILAKLQNTIFIDRKISSLRNQENLIIQHLKKNKNLVIFPEGTSSDGNQVLPFKSALFNIFEEKTSSKIFVQTVTIIYKKVNGNLLNNFERKKITWHSDMNMISNIFNVLKKKSIEVDIVFNKEFIVFNKFNNRKKIALHCWKKINYSLSNSLLKNN